MCVCRRYLVVEAFSDAVAFPLLRFASVLVLAFADCSSSNNNSTETDNVVPIDTTTEPVTGEFHTIESSRVSNYIAAFQGQQELVI